MNHVKHARPNSTAAVSQGKRAIIYRRVSTDDQAESGLGLEAQLTACRAAADRLGLTELEYHVDEGLSGSRAVESRPGLVAALASLRAGDCLIVAKRDRLARDSLISLLIERQTAKAGARIVSAAGEGTADDDPSNVLMRRIIDAFSEYERLMIRVRTLAAMAELRRRGFRIGTVPYGMELQGDGKSLRVVEDELETIVEINDRVTAGESLRTIARDFDRRGIRTKRGRAWSHQSIAALVGRLRPSLEVSP